MTSPVPLLLELYGETEEEGLLPFILNRVAQSSKYTLEAPLVPTARLSLDSYTEAQCKALFRFQRHDIPRLAATLRIPAVVIAPNHSRPTQIEALCIMLRRLAYPCRWVDLRRVFGRSDADLSSIYNWMIRNIYERVRNRAWDRRTLEAKGHYDRSGAIIPGELLIADGSRGIHDMCLP